MTNKPERRSIWTPSRKWFLLYLPLGAFLAVIVGVGLTAAFHTTMEFTNRNEFCYGCHVGMDTIVEEYQASVHYKNASGVAASCADCHVPKAFIPKMITKTIALKDIYHQWRGTINLENFEAHRLRLAEHVWEGMHSDDSANCKSCHNPENWDYEQMPARARLNHSPEKWTKKGQSCVDCHSGIAHQKPRL